MARSAFRPFPCRSLGAPGQGTAWEAGSLETSQHSPAQQLEAGATVTPGNHALTIRQPPAPDIRKFFCLIFYRVSFHHIDPTLCLSSYGLPGLLLWPERYVPTGCQQER